MEIPRDLVEKAGAWSALKRWEKKALGQDLRRLGLSYKEIRKLIPVAAGTLSGWCRDIELTMEQATRLKQLRPAETVRMEIGNRRRQANLQRVASIRHAGKEEGLSLLKDPFWVAGVIAYWAEGDKRCNALGFSNSDPGLVVLFLRWARTYLGISDDAFRLQLHLHNGQDVQAISEHWSRLTSLPDSGFGKPFIKPEGSGHRKNVLYNGTAQVRIRKSTDKFHRVMGWIDAVQSVSLCDKAWAASSIGRAGPS